eukprot:TRINITY_DN24160_c0_g1_i2.p1 TRINITY_DN24160_c0_g1~~TRINITY_DN24160_c0_g1_i2.p1  ORF type:complete len:219 (+),score=44.51 TRINITY_DN24160_c0_g1_i2:121-777(+)
MGVSMARAIDLEEVPIVMFGLDHAGKSTLLHRIKSGKVVDTSPTIGFHIESVRHQNSGFQVWDIGGQEAIREGWRHDYNMNVNGIAFVVDSTDHARLDLARVELHKALEEEQMRNAPLLVVANKQNAPGALSGDEIAFRLGLDALEDRQCFVQEADALAGSGVCEGFTWLFTQARQSAGQSFTGCESMKQVRTSINDSFTFSWLQNKASKCSGVPEDC